MLRESFLLLGLLLVVSGCQSEVAEAPAEAANPLSGAWQLESISYESPDTSWSNQDPAAGQLMFQDDRYSLTLVPGGRIRTLADSATDMERLAVLDDFISNAGSYTVSGSSLTMSQHIAKMPGAMAAGTALTHQHRIIGDTLVLVVSSGWVPTTAMATYRWSRITP